MITLDPKQAMAVNSVDKSTFVTAGPGSGKTRVLVSRIINLVNNHGASPTEILAFTFTRAAAKEMRERLTEALGEARSRQMWIMTIHSFCARVLRQWGERVGLKDNFTIYDSRDQLDIIRAVQKELGVKTKPETLLREIDRGSVPDSRILAYQEFNLRLRQNNATTFRGLLDKCIHLFAHFPDAAEYYARQFLYVHVDEMNDTSEEDYAIISAMASHHKNLFAVGDIDQTIFSFRGAEIENIERLRTMFPEHEEVVLDTTYRCPHSVVKACNISICNNKFNYSGKILSALKDGPGVVLDSYETEEQEAEGILAHVKSAIASGREHSDIAILCRTHKVEEHIAAVLQAAKIPVVVAGTKLKFLDLDEVRAFHTILKVAQNPLDTLPMERIMSMPHTGMKRSDMARIRVIAREMDVSILQAALHHFKEKPDQEIDWLKRIAVIAKAEFKQQVPETHLWLREVYKEQGLTTRVSNLDKLISFIQAWVGETPDVVNVQNYLQYINEITSQDDLADEEDAVRMMTVHGSKGLEFPVVFMPGLENLHFPLNRKGDDPEDGNLEEERRLFYVGMSRTQDQLILSHAAKRFFRGKDRDMKRSVFLNEIAECLDTPKAPHTSTT
jgi:DNA helicase-2/ATP-dependent DNA helicase PcrA